MDLENKLELRVEVRKIVHYDDEKMWGIFGCIPLTNGEEVTLNGFGNFTMRGTCRKLQEYEEYDVIITGPHKNSNPRFGDYYEIVEIKPEKLDSVEAQQKFLRAIVTERQAEILIKAYPDELIVDLIVEGEVDVSKTKGIKEHSLELIKENLINNRAIEGLIAELSDANFTANAIGKIVEHYESADLALNKVKESMYNLCEITGFGFIKVDGYALNRGENKTGERRIKAAITYILKEEAQDGHVWTDREELVEKAYELLGIDKNEIELYISKDKNGLYVECNRVSLNRLYKDEKGILENLVRIKDNYIPDKTLNAHEHIQKTEEKQGFKFTVEQTKTILEAMEHGVYIINGKGGTGKCIKGDSLIFTDKGMLEIQDVPRYFEVDNNDNCKSTVVSYDAKGNKSKLKTSKFYNMGYSKTVRITTSQGYTIEGTPEHPIFIINQQGNLEFKKLSEINSNDVIALSKNNNLFGKNKTVDEELAYLMGILVGDGSTNGLNYSQKKHSLILHNNSEEIIKEFESISFKKFNKKPKTKPLKNHFESSIHSKEIVIKMKEKYDLPLCTAPYKYVPKTILTAPKNVVRSFLQGLFDTDGCFTNNIFEFSTASKKMSRQIHTILLNFGIVSHLRKKKVKNYEENNYFIITISGTDKLKLFENEIGFKNETKKKSKLKEFLSQDIRSNSNIDLLHNLNNKIMDLHYYFLKNDDRYTKKSNYKATGVDNEKIFILNARDRRVSKNGLKKTVSSSNIRKLLDHWGDRLPNYHYLSNITNNIFIDRIASIESSESVVYDFTVPETHSFVANGIINHNTTILSGVTEVLNGIGQTYIAASLSGKAANVLSLKGLHAKTIHRTLGSKGLSKFTYDRYNKMPYDCIILDETSMVNAGLFYKLISAIKDGAKLIIVGDSGQLSGIGHGDILRDLLATTYFKSRELMKIHRQAEASGIITVAGNIREGKQISNYNSPITETFGELQDQTVMTFDSRETVSDVLYSIIDTYKDKLKTYNDIMDFQVLVPNRDRGDLSVKSVNLYSQSVFNDLNKPFIKRGIYEYREGDKVIAKGNTYDIKIYHSLESYNNPTDMFEYMLQFEEEDMESLMNPDYTYGDLLNGTMGVIRQIDTENKTALIEFQGIDGVIALKQDSMDKIQMAYAITVHSSQGSTIENVVFAIDFVAFKLLSKQLVYTGITRASKKCVLLAENNALYKAIDTDLSGNRRTYLADMINNLEEEVLNGGQ